MMVKQSRQQLNSGQSSQRTRVWIHGLRQRRSGQWTKRRAHPDPNYVWIRKQVRGHVLDSHHLNHPSLFWKGKPWRQVNNCWTRGSRGKNKGSWNGSQKTPKNLSRPRRRLGFQCIRPTSHHFGLSLDNKSRRFEVRSRHLAIHTITHLSGNGCDQLAEHAVVSWSAKRPLPTTCPDRMSNRTIQGRMTRFKKFFLPAGGK